MEEGALAELAAGHTSFVFDCPSAALPLIKVGKLRSLAVSSAARSTLIPSLPTAIEAGLAGFDSGNWMGLLAPAGTPNPVIAPLNGDLNLVLQVQEVPETLPDHDFAAMGGTPEHFGAYIRGEGRQMGESDTGGGYEERLTARCQAA